MRISPRPLGGAGIALLALAAGCPAGPSDPQPVRGPEPLEGPGASTASPASAPGGAQGLAGEALAALGQDPPALERALGLVERWLALEPASQEAARLRRDVLLELGHRETYQRCLKEHALHRWGAAHECFRSLPRESRFARLAAGAQEECRTQLSKYHRMEARGYTEAGRYLKAHEHWVQLLELDPCDEAAFVAEQENEGRLRREEGAEFQPYSWSCVDHPRPTPAPPARP